MRSRLGSIEWKFPALITALVIIAVIAFLWSGYARLSGVVREASQARLLSSARLVADMLGVGNPATRARLTTSAASPEFVGFLRSGGSRAAALSKLSTVSSSTSDSTLAGRWLLGPTGDVALASSSAIQRDLWSSAEARAGRARSSFAVSSFFDHGGEALFELVIPVRAVPGDSTSPPLGYLVEARFARGRGLQAVQGLAGTRTLLLGNPDAGVWTDMVGVVEGPPPQFTRADSTLAFASSSRGAGVGAGRPITGTPWILWLELPYSEVMAPVRQWLRRVIPFAALVVLAAAFFAWFASRGITGRLAALTRDMDAIQLGEGMTAPSLIAAPDEIGRLQGAFQHLLERARAHKRIEAQLLESQKLEAVGRLAGGIAHDFNNMLTVVSNYGEMVRADLEPGSSADRDMEEVLRAAERAARLTRQLLTFSGRRPVAPQLLDLNAIIRDSQRMLERLISERVRFLWDLDSAVGPIRADHGHIEQVLMNLVLNASDAMPDGGELLIRTSRASLDAPITRTEELPTEPEVRDRPHVCLSVRDTGIGMDRETASRIFEPFFTTKSSGKGTGLGLATVHGIVTQMGGRIWVYSEPGHGTTFKLYFPEEPGTADLLPARAAAPALAKATGTILLVEDDSALREVTRRMLLRGGYEVLVAEDAVGALNLLRENAGRISLVVSDIVMPGMSGAELAEKIERTRPGLPVLLMSGYHDLPAIRSHQNGTARTLLEKPFSVASLNEAVREAITAAH
jgi:signal transduction histidine kinase/CheY-like chemotaxis protein